MRIAVTIVLDILRPKILIIIIQLYDTRFGLTKMLLNPGEDVHSKLAVHHVDRQSPFAKPACAANPVQVCLVVRVPFPVHRQVKVYHHGNLLHINTCMGENRRHMYSNLASSQLEYSQTVFLVYLLNKTIRA